MLAFLSLILLTGLGAPFPNHRINADSLQRETSIAPSRVFFPIIEDKPRATRLAYAPKLPQDASKPRVAKIISYKGTQCVAYVQGLGFDIHAGAARNWPVAAKKLGYRVDHKAEVGAVFVTNESSYGTSSGHVGIVQKVEGTWLYVRESNYVRLTVTEGWIRVSSVLSFIHKT